MPLPAAERNTHHMTEKNLVIHDLDQAEYDFQVQQYMDKLAQLEGSGNGGGTELKYAA